jgi:alpha-N-arabinofuranosidase
VGTEPYICVNTGSATPEEAANWVEYCNKKGRTKYAAVREANGHPEPYGVKYWGIGNEVYGAWQIGAVDAPTYAKQVIEFSKQMRAVDPGIKLVAVGCERDDWNYEVLRTAGESVDYISLHRYYHYETYYETVASPLDAERRLKHLGGLIAAAMASKRKRRVEISFDEWNVWYKEASGQSGYTQHLALQDGIFAAGMFHVFHRLANSVTMANLAQLVNVLPAIVTDDQGHCYANPIYLAFLMYGHHTGEIALRTRTESPTYQAEKVVPEPVPYLDCSATMSADSKKIFLAVVNRHKDEAMNCRFELIGASPQGQAKMYVLTADKLDMKNTFEDPKAVQIQESTVGGIHTIFSRDFPPHSATILELTLP